MQADFLTGFLSLCKEAGLHTAIDTSGHAEWKDFSKVLPFTDIFLYDIKHLDPGEHKKLTGADNKLILENLQKLSENRKAVEIRMPVIPGHNDSDEIILKTAEFLKEIETLTLVRVLQYHALSGSKYASIGKTHTMPDPSGNEHRAVQRVSDILKSKGLPCKGPD